MLLLKGKAGKSVILEIIHKDKNSKSLTFIYYDQPVIDGGIWVNSDAMDFNDFMAELSNHLSLIGYDINYDYLIIYTNKGETTIRNKKDLIEKWERDFGVTAIVGCK